MAKEAAKRGRPRKEDVLAQQELGRKLTTKYQCTFCHRVFKRNKALVAHDRTHTGEKPYQCDFPGCMKAFTQSSHMRTHMYRHTGEQPFACPGKGCTVRFVHSNRKCPRHPVLKLVKDGKHEILRDLKELSPEQCDWIRSYKESSSTKTSTIRNNVDNPETSSEVRNKKRKRGNESVQLEEDKNRYEERTSKARNRKTSAEVGNPKRKRGNSSVQLAEKSRDKENFPLESSNPAPVKECESCGSRSNSDASSTPERCEIQEQITVDGNSAAEPPEEIKIDEVVEAAQILMNIRNSGKLSPESQL